MTTAQKVAPAQAVAGDPRYLTTLAAIREHSPCKDGWTQLLRSLDKSSADNEPLHLLTVLDSNGLDDALWCLCAVSGIDREARLYAVWCAGQVRHLMTDPRSIEALETAERFANGLSTQDDLNAARAAARAAAWAAARAAARDAAKDAAWAAAWAAWDSAWAAAWAAARVAGASAEATAWAASGAEQEAQFRRMLSGEWPL